MAYIKNTVETAAATTGSTFQVDLGEHASGDLILCDMTNDTGTTPISFLNSSVTADSITDTLLYSGSDYWTNGDQITLSGTTAPGGTSLETVRYFIISLNTTLKTFQISTTSGGSAVNMTSNGTSVVANLMTTGTNHPLGTGWKMLGMQKNAAGGGMRKAFGYKIATSSNETAPTFYGASDDWYGITQVILDAHATAPFGSETDGTDWAITNTTATGTTVDNPSLTTATDGCLLIYSIVADTGASASKFVLPKPITLPNLQKLSNTSIIACSSYDQQQSAGAIPTVTMYKVTATAVQYWAIAIRNKSGGALQPMPRYSGATLLYWHGTMGGTHDPTLTWYAPNAIFGSTMDGTPCSSTTASISNQPTVGDYAGVTAITSTENVTAIESPAGSGAWVGAWHDIASTDFSNKIFHYTFHDNQLTTLAGAGVKGYVVGFSDGTNWAVFQVQKKITGFSTSPNGVFIACGSGKSTPYASSGTLNWSAITRIGYFTHRKAGITSSVSTYIKNEILLDKIVLTGGGSSRPLTVSDMRALTTFTSNDQANVQGNAQALGKVSLQIGDGGTNTTYFDMQAASLEYPRSYSCNSPSSQSKWNALDGVNTLSVYAGASDTILLSSGVVATSTQQALTINSSSSTSATYSFAGTSFVGWAPTLKTGIDVSSATFSQCGKIDAQGANLTSCIIKKTTSTDAALSASVSGATYTGTNIDLTGVTANYHLELGTSVTSITLNAVTFTGTAAIDKVHVKKTSGTVTITIDASTSLTLSDITSDGATVNLVSPTLQRGLAFTGLVAGSKVKVFTTGTDTEKFSTASSSTSETWDDATSGSITVDYVVMKAGYLPIRVTGVVVTGAVSGGLLATPITQVADRTYQASSGLTINTNVFANATTKKFGLTTASTVQNFYSYMIEQWIALGDTTEAFANKQFPIVSNGSDSFTFINGWEWDTSTYPNSITNLSRDGLRYLNTSGTVTASWAAILTSGVPSGAQVRYQQSDGGTTQNALATGDMNQLVQIYGDATHGNFDYTNYLVLKVQAMGYDQAEADAFALYGTLQDQLYVVGLFPISNGVATGNPSLANPPTITDHGASPVTWNSKVFSITITDSAAGNTGTDIIRWLRYYFETGGTFQGKNAFNWHDLVQVNGSSYKTVRGKIYGDTGATLKGVRVVKSDGTTSHDYVTVHTADDGTTVNTTPPAAVNATVLANSRVQLYNDTTSTEIDNQFITGTSYSYIISSEASSGHNLRLRVTKLGYEPIELPGVWSAAGLTFLVSQVTDPVYSNWGIDGSTVTEFSLDVTGNIEIDSNDPDGNSTKTRLGAWVSYALTSADGIRSLFGAVSPLATNAIRINVDVVDLTIENINSSKALTFTDNAVRLYRSDGSIIIAATSYSLHNDYSGVPDVVETGTSGLTTSESNQLNDIYTKTSNIQDGEKVATQLDVLIGKQA